ncbi:MAG: hypothetical protein ACJ788_18245 [Ktedonobacteraceae bacterium]
MHPLDMKQEAFRAWLHAHEHEVVGHPGTCFHSPLAEWLSSMTGHVYGVDGKHYGRASWDFQFWFLLPQWAERFAARTERLCSHEVTGREAFAVLCAPVW